MGGAEQVLCTLVSVTALKRWSSSGASVFSNGTTSEGTVPSSSLHEPQLAYMDIE